MTKKKTSKKIRPPSQVSSRVRARAKITAEALRQREGASSLEDIGNQLELPSWVRGLVLPAMGEAESNKKTLTLSNEELMERIKEARRRDGIITPGGRRIFPSEE